MRLVLASSSPRRREILGWLGLKFELVEPDADELTTGLDPAGLVVENARRKARAGAELAAPGAPPLVLGVDTDVFAGPGHDPLGKPADRAEAEARLRALSGRTHEVWSGICLFDAATGTERTAAARSLVTFRPLGDELLRLYLDSGEWRGRAGAYAIQGIGSILVERLEGDLSNVIGLPLEALIELEPRFSAISPTV